MSSPLAPEWLTVPENTAALDAKIFSAGVARDDQHVTVQGVPVTELVEQFGSPLWVLDENDFRARARAYADEFHAAFAPLCGGVDVYYASKALLTVQVATWVRDEGLRIDTASGGEMAIAMRAGSNRPISVCTETISPIPNSTRQSPTASAASSWIRCPSCTGLSRWPGTWASPRMSCCG